MGAVAFIRNPQLHYLLLHYEEGHWVFLKGTVEFNESEKETVIRELEETGIIDAKFIEGFRDKVTYIYIRNGQPIYKQVVFFLIETHTKNIRLSFEHSNSLWVPFINAIKCLTFNNSKNVLKKANSFLKTRKFI